jgi:protein phosphatase 1 regulatory subunit 7
MHQSRIDNPKFIDKEQIRKELSEGKHVIVQLHDDIYTDKLLKDLDDLCIQYNDNFGIRFYGYYSNSFDCNTLLKIPNVKCLYVDCLLRAENVYALSQLKNLVKLNLGIYYIKELEILKYDNLKTLTSLFIGETSTKAFNLNYLREYQNLKSFGINGHTKNIEAIGEIKNLEELSLNSIKKKAIPFVNKLKKLKSLTFILGGRENINEIEENNIENLEITWVHGFKDISNLSKFTGLKKLLIDRQKQLSSIHIEKEMSHLIDLKILDCKTFNSLTGLENLTGLQQLRISGTQLDFNSVINQKLSPALKTFAFYTWKVKQDEVIKQKLEELGYNEF